MKNKIHFKTLTIRNFLSFGNNITVFDLTQPGITAVAGEDLDNTVNGKSANGCGKTAILNALTYAIYDKPVSDISKDNLINNVNNKNMQVTIEFEKDGNEYLIERARKMKAGAEGNYVNLIVNGIDKSQSAKETNAAIQKIVGVPYELFVQIVVFSATSIPFFKLPATSTTTKANQRDMIEELFGLTEISGKADLLKQYTKDINGQLQTQETRLTQIEREHQRLEDQIDSVSARMVKWNGDNKSSVERLTKELTLLSEMDLDYEGELLKHEELQLLTNTQTELGTEQSSIERSRGRTATTKEKLITELAHLKNDECPYCHQEFGDAETKRIDVNTELEQLHTQLKELDQTLEVVEDKYVNITQKIKNKKGDIKVKKLNELLEMQTASGQLETRLMDATGASNPHKETLQELIDTTLDPLDYEPINKLKKEIDHIKFLNKLLTKKDSFVRRVLLNKNLPFLNSRLQKYLSELGLPHLVEFTPELTAKISRFGRELDFGNLSNGQAARVNFALSFAFRDVLQILHSPINLCIMDEVMDVGLDTIGIQAAASLLKRKARSEDISMYIISHRDEIEDAFDRTLTVQLSKGFSYIKE